MYLLPFNFVFFFFTQAALITVIKSIDQILFQHTIKEEIYN